MDMSIHRLGGQIIILTLVARCLTTADQGHTALHKRPDIEVVGIPGINTNQSTPCPSPDHLVGHLASARLQSGRHLEVVQRAFDILASSAVEATPPGAISCSLEVTVCPLLNFV
jgi:hypothetical protein